MEGMTSRKRVTKRDVLLAEARHKVGETVRVLAVGGVYDGKTGTVRDVARDKGIIYYAVDFGGGGRVAMQQWMLAKTK